MSLEDVSKLKLKVSKLRRAVDKAQAAIDHRMGQLAQEFECGSLEEAQRLLAQMREDAKEAGEAFKQALAEFEERWWDVL